MEHRVQNPNFRTCELSRFNRRNKQHDFRENVPGTDYFENNCLTSTYHFIINEVNLLISNNFQKIPGAPQESCTS